MKTETEIWKDIPDYEGYQVSNLGRGKSLFRSGRKNEIILNPLKSSNGYLKFTLSLNGKTKQMLIHRLVAIVFIPNPENKPTVNHKFGNKWDNRASVLEWNTHAENRSHTFKFKLDNVSIPVTQYDLSGIKIKNFDSIVEASEKTGANQDSIRICIKGGRLKSAGGFIWKKTFPEQSRKISRRKIKAVDRKN